MATEESGPEVRMEFFDPVAVWDANTPEWTKGPMMQRMEWIRAQGIDVNLTVRIEFYVIDTTFAVVRQAKMRRADGRVVGIETPDFLFPLDQLPPREIL